MDIANDIKSAECRIRASGVSVAKWLDQNEISVPAWYRWKQGAIPRADVWEQVQIKLMRLPTVTEAAQ